MNIAHCTQMAAGVWTAACMETSYTNSFYTMLNGDTAQYDREQNNACDDILSYLMEKTFRIFKKYDNNISSLLALSLTTAVPHT